MYICSAPLRGERTAGVLTTLHDASSISAKSAQIWRTALSTVVPPAFLIGLITYLVVQSTTLEPIAKTARWMRDLRVGRAAPSLDSVPA